MVEEKKTWREARLSCLADVKPETNDSSLALIHTEEENNFLAKKFGRQTTEDLWLGAVQPVGSPEPKGRWSWLDGTKLDDETFTNWALGEPNNSPPSQNCLFVRFGLDNS